MTCPTKRSRASSITRRKHVPYRDGFAIARPYASRIRHPKDENIMTRSDSASPEDAIALARELETRAPNEREIAELFRICRKDANAIDALCASARVVRDKEGLPAEREAAFNSVLRCHLRPLYTYCPYWRSPGQRSMTENEVLEFVRVLSEETDVRQFHLSGGSRRDGIDCGMTTIARAARQYPQARLVKGAKDP